MNCQSEKTCTNCNKTLDISSFYIRNKKNKNGFITKTFQSICKKCSSIRRMKYYNDNRDIEIQKRKLRENDIKAWFIEFKKTLSCFKCGDTRWYVIDFHHHNNDKEFNVSDICKNYSKKTILKEIEKCVPLCANCHREHHFLDRKNYTAFI